MNYIELLKSVEDHINLFYREHIDERLLYHNYAHTSEVADTAKKIALHYQLNERDLFIVCTAAWFHDTGYFLADPQSHTSKSAELAEDFLKSIGVKDEDIIEIKKCILSTQMPQTPTSLNEKIVCDADLFYLGTDRFKEKERLLRKETEALNNKKISGSEWRKENIKMLETHSYRTDYCQKLLDKTKAENLNRLKRKQEEKTLDKSVENDQESNLKERFLREMEFVKNEIEGDSKKNPRPKRGIETMFRIVSSKDQRISMMADNKAHIMISVNSIIISAIIALVVRHLFDEYRVLIIPTIILLIVNVTTIIYSILATRPRILGGVFTAEQVEKKSVNLLFFGSYYKMGYKEYEAGMKQMLEDGEFLYGSLIKDVYWQGKVLGRKYKLLRISYDIFMYGIVIAVLAYAAAILFYL